MEEKLIVIRTITELEKLSDHLQDKEFVAFDTETTGLDKESEVIGFSVSSAVDEGYYVILSYWDVSSQKLVYLETREGAKKFLAGLQEKQLIMHNAVFDCSMVSNNFGVGLMPSVHTDTMILAHLLNENRGCGLKDLGVAIFGEDAAKEAIEMRHSVSSNGGSLTKDKYELYKADADLIGRYGAKDAILTLKLFYHLIPDLFDQGLDKFFYEDESMPLLRGPTYDLNTTGLRVDPDKLQNLKGTLETEIMEAKAFVAAEIASYIADKYPGTNKRNVFNIGSSKQLSWLLFFAMENEFHLLTDEGKGVCKALGLGLPYSPGAKREFIRMCNENKGNVWQKAGHFNAKTKKTIKKDKKIQDPWSYIASGKKTLSILALRYKWVEKLLELRKAEKILNTYVMGIRNRMKYNVIRPGFLQHGTTSGRYSSQNPNFQNLPRDDKRVKSCIISRPGKVFVGADYSQLEPRVFASLSGDARLLASFKSGADFYSVIGMEVFNKHDCVPLKDGRPDAFGIKYKSLRDISKVVALASTYGASAFQLAPQMGKNTEEAREVIENYFQTFPGVLQFMLDSHEMAKTDGRVTNIFGRPRRMPDAKLIKKYFGNTPHDELDYNWRNILNLATNHRVQGTGASIMNRAAIAFNRECAKRAKTDARWLEVKIVLQVHDELIVEGPGEIADHIATLLKRAMENTVSLPGVDLIAEPKIANNLADLK